VTAAVAVGEEEVVPSWLLFDWYYEQSEDQHQSSTVELWAEEGL